LQKKFFVALAPKARCTCPNMQKHAPIVTSPTENPKSELFQVNWKTCWIRRRFEHLASSIVWWVMALQTWTNPKSGRDEKGQHPKQISAWEIGTWRTSPILCSYIAVIPYL